MSKTRHIALIWGIDSYDYTSSIPSHVSDWAEVSEEDYRKLRSAQEDHRFRQQLGDFIVIEKPGEQSVAVKQTIEAYLDFVRNAELRLKAQQEEARKKREAEAEKRRAKAAEKELRLLQKLKQKYEEQK